MKKKALVIISIVLSVIVLGFGVFNKLYGWVYGDNVNQIESYHLYLQTDSDIVYLDSIFKVDSVLKDLESFERVADRKKFTAAKSGHYLIKPGMSNNEIINMLRSGWQTPVRLSFIAQKNIKKLSRVIADQMVFDSTQFYNYVSAEFLKTNDLKVQLLPAYFIPNTYEVYWNETADQLANRLFREYGKFWNENRVEQARSKGLAPAEVSILASIVEGETNKVDEMPTVAGLYINRLRKGMKLESDPTIRFCIQQKKGEYYVVRRVLNKDLKIDSPYNTYLYKGLPPGPLSIPSLQAINSVLNAESNNYIFMCADPETGYHNFTSSYNQHLRNRKKYTDWLQKNKISR